MNKFELKEISQGKKEVWFGDVNVCDFLLDVDGYFYCDFGDNKGLFSDWELVGIGNLLKDLNKEWDDQIIEYFENEKIKLQS